MSEEIKKILYPNLSEDSSKNHWSGIWYLLKGYRLIYGSALIALSASLYFRSSLNLVLAWFVDTWLKEETHTVPLWSIGGIFILFNVIQGALSYYSGIQMNKTAEEIVRRLRNNLYNHIQRLSFTWHDKADTGDLIVRATGDIDEVKKLFSEQVYGIVRVCSFAFINFVMIRNIHKQLALRNLIVLPVIFIASIIYLKVVEKIYERYQNQDSIVSTVLQENLTGVRVVKAFARQQYEIEKFTKECDKQYKIGEEQMVKEAFLWPITGILCYLQIALSFYWGTKAALAGEITLGNFVAYQSLVTMIVWPLRNLGRQIVNIGRSLVSFKRIRQIIQTPQEDLQQGIKDMDFHGSIVFDHVHFGYDGTEALKDISFETKPGQVTAVIGSTGSGKTSLINLLPRFYEYQNGSITFDGIELNQISRETLRGLIGIVEQEPFLFSCTIAENIAFGVEREVTREEIIAAAKAAAIHESIMEFENNYDTIIGERGVTLSGGQKQRVAIARAFLKDPRILILDDSLSAVDTLTESVIQDSLRKLMKGRTSFIIAHRITSIMDADQILVLDKGEIVQRGTHDELLQEEGLYKEIHDIQTRIEDELNKEVSGE